MESDIRVISVEPFFSNEVARVPLKFGAVVMDRVTYCQVRATVENRHGERASGFGAIFLADFWGFPSPLVPHPQRDRAMREVVRRFAKTVEDYEGYAHPLDIFLETEEELRRINAHVCTELGLAEEMPFLGALVCASPVDAALHDGFGNVNGICTYDGYSREFMAHDLGYYLGPEFEGKYPADYLRPAYLSQLPIFHLVGGLDKLRASELDESDPQDGLPVSLDQWVEREGLICLKVKLRGNDLDWDVERMLEVSRVAHEGGDGRGVEQLYFSADTNEQCEGPEYLIEMLRRIEEADRRTFEELLYLEQPTERDLTAHRFDMHELSDIKPVVVDESLTTIEDLELAMELGWSGIALKTCKCQSSDLLFIAKAAEAGIPYTVQDLTNPGIALIQSVGLAARSYPLLGVEANSRQFFPATSKPERRVHPGLFNVVEGRVSTASMRGTGFGYRMGEIGRVWGDR